MQESCTPGSVGEVSSNRHLYPMAALAPSDARVVREGRREAFTGEGAGEVLSGVRQVRGADVFRPTEGNTAGVDIARHTPTPRRRRPWHAQKPFARQPGALHRRPRQSWPGRCREGRRLIADDECEGESDLPEVAWKRANKAASAVAVALKPEWRASRLSHIRRAKLVNLFDSQRRNTLEVQEVHRCEQYCSEMDGSEDHYA